MMQEDELSWPTRSTGCWSGPYGAAALSQRSRVPLYRAAADAYRSVELLEHGDEAALRTIVTEAVVGPLEGWRRFELWVALKLDRERSSCRATRMALECFTIKGSLEGR